MTSTTHVSAHPAAGAAPSYRREDRLISTVLPDGTWALFDSETEAVAVLSAPAGMLWEMCDGLRGVAELADEILQLYPAEPAEVVKTDVVRTVHDLERRGLVRAA